MSHFDMATQAGFASDTSPLRNTYQRGGKRLLDVALALLLLPIIAPVLLCILCINRAVHGSSLFGHTRIGRDGRSFVCWKVQTMLPSSDALLARHLTTNARAAEEWLRTQKLTNDPRVTGIGRFLRRTSLDELPQIWNVLRGDMSFVGPRPITENEAHRYGRTLNTYQSVRPGITGHWQIYGRTNGCYQVRVQMDETYCRSMSILSDLFLIALTGLVIFKTTGR